MPLVTDSHPGWASDLGSLQPGAHVAVFTDRIDVGIEGRLAGLELRDSLLVLRVGPSAGLVLLFRMPLALGTVVSQVLSTGTGGLNVGACRVAHVTINGGNLADNPHLRETKERAAPQVTGFGREGDVTALTSQAGRWPPNVLLVHGPGCVPLGTRSVKGSGPTPSGFDRYNRANATQGYRPGEYQRGPVAAPASRLGEDGLESVPVWQCEPGCPVGLLDGQSGELPTGGPKGRPSDSQGFTRGGSGAATQPAYPDAGGASRFYPQFASEGELRAWLTRLVGGSG